MPVVLGRARAVSVYRAALVAWIAAIVVIVAIWFRGGLIVVPFMLLSAYPIVKALYGNTFTADRRLQAMPQILSVNVVLGSFYSACMLASGALSLVL
ncbi:MAG TPA: hypothetical protein DCP91_11790 [Eggerthellaceae bacterium]|nr:hypothetical protein [Eggerthellaceae bacterium]